ncbi:MAG: glutamyl-tRNA reductase [Desulfurococcaceae archaeon]
MSEVIALLIGHGSTNPSQREVIQGLARIVESRGVFSRVFYAFMRVNEPKLDEVLHAIVREGYRRVVAIPIFVSEGSHTVEDIPDALGVPRGARRHRREVEGVEVEIFYAKPLGVDARIAEVAIERGLEALGGFDGERCAAEKAPAPPNFLSGLYCYAITHKKADVYVLDKCQVHDQAKLMREIKAEELVVLQTCNRVEVYFVGGEESLSLLNGFFSGRLGFDAKACSEVMTGLEAARHLYRVASSLESMFVGEEEILGQVREALRGAEGLGTVGARLKLVFQGAIAAGRRARRETAISSGSVSIPSVAVKRAERLLGGLGDKVALVLGAGRAGELLLKELVKRKTRVIIIANRTFDRAVKLAERLCGQPVRLDERELPSYIAKADVIFVATRAPHLIIKAKHVEDAIRMSGRRPAIFDLAIPRNVDENIKSKLGVEVYTIDELRAEAEENLKMRIKEVPKVERSIEEELLKLQARILRLSEVEKAKKVVNAMEAVRRSEVEKAMRRLKAGGEAERVVELLSISLVKKTARELVKAISGDHGEALMGLARILGAQRLGGEVREAL